MEENLERVEDIVVESQPKDLHLRGHMEVSVPNLSRPGVAAVFTFSWFRPHPPPAAPCPAVVSGELAIWGR
jgi:hypothetical protein